MRQARLPEQVIGIAVDIAPVADQQRRRNTAGRMTHAGGNFIRAQLPEPAKPRSKTVAGIRLDIPHRHHITACHNIADTRLNAMVAGAVHDRRRRRVDPRCHTKPRTRQGHQVPGFHRQAHKTPVQPALLTGRAVHAKPDAQPFVHPSVDPDHNPGQVGLRSAVDRRRCRGELPPGRGQSRA